ncbi:TIGR02391 family protein [Nonomuraea fuscirosea]|uniref:TIGR02391 family protein n=1 Tax=Nonomuraea fuscirosea TaxID=1291556 RepID=UPI0037B15252
MSLDVQWAIGELNKFLALAKLRPIKIEGAAYLGSGMWNAASDEEIVPSAQIVEKILDRILPRWRVDVPKDDNKRVNRWCQHIDAARRAIAELERQEEVAEKLGENGPDLNATSLHPWIWDAAKALWQVGHYRSAVGQAAIVLNAETQNKIGRRDVSEKDLFRQAFTLKAPEQGKARLRLMQDDGSPTYTSIHEGAAAFAEGCYRAIRNPTAHVPQTELAEHEALEQLAAFSVLARWVDAATVEK